MRFRSVKKISAGICSFLDLYVCYIFFVKLLPFSLLGEASKELGLFVRVPVRCLPM